VSERRREQAIRAALGAAPARLRRGIIAQGLAVTVVGLAAGVGLSLAAGRALSTVLFGVRPYDPATYGATVVGVLTLGVVACYLPARSAAGADPAALLKE
jgi:putative ABC transport system permease protein